MHPICSLTPEVLQRRINESKIKLRLHTTLKKITRVARPLIALALLTTFTLLNPRSLPFLSLLHMALVQM